MGAILLDANLLVLLIVGLRDPKLIGKHKRTTDFDAEDFEFLRALLNGYDQIVVTPNVLTEASNLLRQTNPSVSAELMALMQALLVDAEERYVESSAACDVNEFPRLGLTDAALLNLVSEELPLLTVDANLFYAAAKRAPLGATNFNHVRPLA